MKLRLESRRGLRLQAWLGAGLVVSGMLGLAASRPQAAVLSDQFLEDIRGTNSGTRSPTQDAVDCASINTGDDENTIAECVALAQPGPNQWCVKCSDVIATFLSTLPSPNGAINLRSDGLYNCSGAKSRVPCTISGCGTWPSLPNFGSCEDQMTDWDPQPASPVDP